MDAKSFDTIETTINTGETNPLGRVKNRENFSNLTTLFLIAHYPTPTLNGERNRE
jgi:hypothetical protein